MLLLAQHSFLAGLQQPVRPVHDVFFSIRVSCECEGLDVKFTWRNISFHQQTYSRPSSRLI